MDKFTRKTTPEERAMDYARGVKYVGGEIQLAMQAAVVGAFIEGRKDAIEEARRGQPGRNAIADTIRLGLYYGKTPGELADDVLNILAAAAKEGEE